MPLNLTPDVLCAAYEFLRATQPFRRWRLPHADDVEFRILRTKDLMGLYDGGEHTEHRISVSEARVGNTMSLMETVAHEMVHLRQDEIGGMRQGEHGKVFQKLAALVCKHHGFDPKRF